MSVFESEVNAVAGADGEGVKEQCRYNISCNSFLYTRGHVHTYVYMATICRRP